MKNRITIALDTNFLLYCTKQKIDIIRELDRLCTFAYDIITPQQVIAELEKLAGYAKGKDNKTADIVLQLLYKLVSEKKVGIKMINAGDADDALLKLDKRTCIIATLDKELRKKLKNAKLLGIKQFKYLYFA